MSYGPWIFTGARVLLLAAKGVKNAIESFDVESVPKDEQLACEGKELLDKNRLDEAQEMFHRATNLNPRSFSGWAGKALVAMRRGVSEETCSYADRLIWLEPRSPEGHSMRAMGLILQENYALALESLRKARDLDETNHLYPKGIGECLLSLNRPHEALAAFKQSISLKWDDMNAHLGKARALNQLAQETEALQILLHYQKYSPLHLNILTALSVSYAQIRRVDEAQQCIDRAIALVSGTDADSVKARENSQYAWLPPSQLQKVILEMIEIQKTYSVLPSLFAMKEVVAVCFWDSLIKIQLASSAGEAMRDEIRLAISPVSDYKIQFDGPN